MLLIAGCAAGAGVTGTLLFARGDSAPAYVPVAPDTSPVASDEPPPNLTQGMAPAEAQVTLGNWYYDHDRWPEAISHYKNAIAGGMDNPNVRTDMGNALRFSGEPQEALEQYKIAQRQDPQHEQSLFNQGGLWAFSLNDKARGIAIWRAYLKKFPRGGSADAARQLLAQAQSKAEKP